MIIAKQEKVINGSSRTSFVVGLIAAYVTVRDGDIVTIEDHRGIVCTLSNHALSYNLNDLFETLLNPISDQ